MAKAWFLYLEVSISIYYEVMKLLEVSNLRRILAQPQPVKTCLEMKLHGLLLEVECYLKDPGMASHSSDTVVMSREKCWDAKDTLRKAQRCTSISLLELLCLQLGLCALAFGTDSSSPACLL